MASTPEQEAGLQAYLRDRQQIVETYSALTEEQKLPGVSPDEFANHIWGRALLEAVLNEEGAHLAAEEPIQPFVQWVNHETHMLMKAQGFQWNPERQDFNFQGLGIALVYDRTRKQILDIIVARSIDYFSRCQKVGPYFQPQEGDMENLRTSLVKAER